MNDYITVILFIIGLIIVGLIVSYISSLLNSFSKQKNKNSKKKKTANSKISTTNTPSNRNRLSSDQEILNMSLEEMSWKEFERLCYLYYEAKGYKPQETSEGADGGVDLIIFDKKHNTNCAVQIKKYKKTNIIGVQPIRELDGAKKNHGCVLANFITTSSFTKDALQQADKLNIETYDKGWVENNIIKWKDKQAIS